MSSAGDTVFNAPRPIAENPELKVIHDKLKRLFDDIEFVSYEEPNICHLGYHLELSPKLHFIGDGSVFYRQSPFVENNQIIKFCHDTEQYYFNHGCFEAFIAFDLTSLHANLAELGYSYGGEIIEVLAGESVMADVEASDEMSPDQDPPDAMASTSFTR